MQDPQIFLSSSGALVRFAREEVLPVEEEAKTGGAVPPRALIRRLSVMLAALLVPRQRLTNILSKHQPLMFRFLR